MKQSLLKGFGRKKILLIGDVILDIYIYCDVVSQALYAPVPEVEEKRTEVSFGGNGLVAKNMLELGGTVSFISVIGADQDAKYYDSLKHPRLEKLFITDKTRRTTVKRRWFADGKALLQANQVDNHNISSDIEKKIIKLARERIEKVDAMVIMDPQHGMLTKNLIKQIVGLSAKHKKPLYVDAQISHRPSNHHLYKGADVIVFNQREALAVYPKFDVKSPQKSLKLIKNKLDLNNVVVKLGPKGSVALCSGELVRSRAPKVRVVDVCGAGDAFLAAFSLGDINKPEENLRIANAWGALSTTVHGTVPPRKIDLLAML